MTPPENGNERQAISIVTECFSLGFVGTTIENVLCQRINEALSLKDKLHAEEIERIKTRYRNETLLGFMKDVSYATLRYALGEARAEITELKVLLRAWFILDKHDLESDQLRIDTEEKLK